MADESVQRKKGAGFFRRTFARIAKWFREMRSELKKVVWPTKKQVINNTVVALVVILVAAIVIWGFDELASMAVSLIISIGN